MSTYKAMPGFKIIARAYLKIFPLYRGPQGTSYGPAAWRRIPKAGGQ